MDEVIDQVAAAGADDVEDIVADYLRSYGYDGLFNADADCACELDDLAPCGEASFRCRPGFRFGCDCGEHDFHVGTAAARDHYLAEHANDELEADLVGVRERMAELFLALDDWIMSGGFLPEAWAVKR